MHTRYTGRIDAELSMTDCVLLLRDGDGEDGSCLLYAVALGVTPRNWMPAGSIVRISDAGFDIEHVARGERLQVWLDRTHPHETRFTTSTLHGELVKVGDERAFSALLSRSPEAWLSGLHSIEREYRTSAGPVDIFGVLDDRPVCVEVKRRRITLADTYQLLRYLDAVTPARDAGAPAQAMIPLGVLVAPVLAEPARRRISEVNEHAPIELLRFVRMSWERLTEAADGDRAPAASDEP